VSAPRAIVADDREEYAHRAMPPTDSPRRSAVWLGLLVVLGAAVLRVDYLRHAGPLWRDEIDSMNVAAQPSLAAVLAHAHLDSFPIAWVTLLHGWIASGLGDGDEGVRRLGLVIGLATLAAVWWSGWRLAGRVPLTSLVLLGASPTMVVYGSEVRGYGLGALAAVACMAVMWDFVTRPGRGTFVAALLAAVLTVQTNYANAFLLVAICAGAAAVAVSDRAWARVGAVAAIGTLAGLSLAIDAAGIVHAARDTVIDQGDYSLAARFAVFRESLAPGLPLLAVLWPVAAVLAGVGWVLARGDDRARALFAATTVVVTIASFAAYLGLVARVSTQYWYYLSPMAVLATAWETGIAALARRYRAVGVGEAAVVAVVATVLVVTGDAAAMARVRMTNLDLVARSIEADLKADDLVVVLPWYCGTSFGRYYRGTAPWIAFPDVHFTESARPHAQVAERMTRGDAGVAPELERIEHALRAGGRVWIVGQPLLPPLGQGPPSLPPAPSGPEGWASGPYLEGWAFRLGALMRAGVRDVWRIPVPDPGPVNVHEDLPLVLLDGWK
jgi:hypothetical protein